MKQLYFICVILIISTSSCKSPKEAMQSSTALYNTKWSLIKIHGNGNEEIVNTKAFIRFDKEKGSAGGNSSCNNFGSSATINGNEVSFKNIFSTKMYCDAVQSIEDDFFAQLQKVTRYEIKGNTLLLFAGDNLLLDFEAS